MNYYPRYPAHYLAKTLHLTMLQDGAYTRLIDWYYTNERPVPHAQRYAIARCQSSAERKAVDEVLADFFEQRDDSWANSRIEDEIAKAAPKIAAAKANGAKGGRPRNQNPSVTHEEPNGFNSNNPLGFSEKPRAKAPQSPYPITKSEIEKPAGVTWEGEAGRAMRDAGCHTINQSNVDFLAARDEGVTAKELSDAVGDARSRGINGAGLFAYAIGIARTNHAKTATTVIAPLPRAGPQPVQGKTMTAIMALEGMKNGLDQTRTADGLPETAHARLGTTAGG
ncbi:uncharacterized protein YdaU (DUF1376 family) [Dyella sp. SG562]|uniref:YdaU family protein n=1 Tax=Dyella sp. SG562 TaxID=2587017 RepID=UPI0014233B12|nr:YdaU family protein [Dyella sp. SG562]NII73935.1 uncharacterized protein YdaU (DUF1376 family) [Dyella sp. SG562]